MNHLSIRILCLLVLGGLVSAGPLARRQALPKINPTDFENVRIYEQYAAAAYCGTNINPGSPTATLICSVGNCPDVGTATFVPKGRFTDLPMYHTSGYVAVDVLRRLIVVAYRGTIPTDELSVQANIDSAGFQTSVNYCPNGGCSVATGYLKAFNESRAIVIAAVKAALVDHPTFQVVTTGHSLGGSVATIAALELRSMSIPVHAASYGMPRILNPALGTFVSGQDIGANPKNRNFRITHQEDAVSDMVPQTFTDEETGKTTFWRHVIPSYLITTDDIDIPTANDIDVVPTDEDVPVDGIGALLNLGTIIDAHRMYFNQISACGPEIIVEPPTFAQYEDVLGFGNSPFGK